MTVAVSAAVIAVPDIFVLSIAAVEEMSPSTIVPSAIIDDVIEPTAGVDDTVVHDAVVPSDVRYFPAASA
ncbi:MAG: hypothetical protein EBW14_13885 [Oxalobacteraceae bacterium]|nr:hypothetical protein [Oxalobacteraceae bacterium]